MSMCVCVRMCACKGVGTATRVACTALYLPLYSSHRLVSLERRRALFLYAHNLGVAPRCSTSIQRDRNLSSFFVVIQFDTHLAPTFCATTPQTLS